jgi:hypothetical protein
MQKLSFFALVAIIAFSAFKTIDSEPSRLFKGTEVSIGNGKAWSWIKTGKGNKPEAIGVTLTKDALTNLPGGHGHAHGTPFVLQLPHEKKSLTPFDHIGMDWNPNGHEPDHIYDKPHFDFHFYIQPLAERLAIPTYEQDSAKFKDNPGNDYFPATYRNFGGGVPQMGAHWVDVTSPELNPTKPAPFTQTFIYGSYNGKVTFMEPMITKKFIEENDQFERDIPQPAKFQKSGYYPTKMRIAKTEKEIQVILDNFVYRKKS